jgi:hypothetical protein
MGENIEKDKDIELDDEKTEEEKKKEAEEEKKKLEEEEKQREEESKQEGAAPRNRVEEIINYKTEKEFKKIHKMYEQKFIVKSLRLLEVFTSIALNNSQIFEFVMKVTKPSQLAVILRLLMKCNYRHGMIIIKIIENLINIGFDPSLFNEAIEGVKKAKEAQHVFDLKPITKFDKSEFLQFLFNYLYSIRACQWTKREFEGSGGYSISCGLVRIFRSILSSEIQPDWKEHIEATMDNFVENIDTYSIEEFDTMISIFDGGEYLGLNIGSYGMNKDKSEFIVAGFVKRWYGLSPPNSTESYTDFQILDVEGELTDKEDYLLAISYDKAHPERNDMFLASPEEVNLIQDIENTSHDYFLNKDRLNKFMKAMEISSSPDKSDPTSLSRRCIGMKILVNQIQKNGKNFADLLDEKFKNEFVNFLLHECALPEQQKDVMRCEWLEQKLFAMKKYASEHQSELKPTNDTSISFNGELMAVSKPLLDSSREQYSKCLPLLSAMNYGKIIQKMQYKV